MVIFSVTGSSADLVSSAPTSPGGSFRRKPGRGRLAGGGDSSHFNFKLLHLALISLLLFKYKALKWVPFQPIDT